jgi:excisionase family DNA binding protein
MSERTDDNYISLDDAAEYLNIKPVTLRKWIKQKIDLPAHQIGRLWKFKCSELDAWINSGKSATN